MDTLDARIEQEGEKRFLRIGEVADATRIPISDDDPKAVKQAFNQLLSRLRTGVFKIELKDPGEDLFSQVALEYLRQLNGELEEVRREIERADLSSG